MRSLPETRLFCRADARRRGWPDATFSRAVRAGLPQRVRRDHFTGGPIDPVVAAAAAAHAYRGSVVSHRSAALLHGLPLYNLPPGRSSPSSRAVPDAPAAPTCTALASRRRTSTR